jgi:MFS family permease
MSLWSGFKRKLITSGLGWIGVGVGYLAVTFMPASRFTFFLLAMGFIGFMVPVGSAPLTAFYQTYIPNDMQGRVFAVLGSIDNATIPLGLIIAAVLGGLAPVRLWYFLVGASHALLGISWLFLPFIRNAESHLTHPKSELSEALSRIS